MQEKITIPIGFGGILAAALSYYINHSIGWAIWHGILGWLYVVYKLLCWWGPKLT